MRFAFKMFLALVLSGGCLSARADLVDAIQAIVGDSVITYQQIQSLLIPRQEMLLLQSKNDPQQFNKLQARLETDILKTMVDEKMILHEFSTAGFKIPENIIEDYVQDQIREEFHDDRVRMMKQLQHEGLTYEDFKQRLHDNFIVRVMQSKFVPDPIISPLKIETYYQAHHADYKVEAEMKMKLIVLNKQSDDTNNTVRKRMEEIISQIKDGASFGELARSYSEGSQRSESGETGWQEVSKLNKVIVDAAEKLKPGEYSGVLESPEAYFVVLLEERRAARVRPLSEVRPDIEKILTVQEKDRLWTRWTNRLRRKTFVQTF